MCNQAPRQSGRPGSRLFSFASFKSKNVKLPSRRATGYVIQSPAWKPQKNCLRRPAGSEHKLSAFANRNYCSFQKTSSCIAKSPQIPSAGSVTFFPRFFSATHCSNIIRSIPGASWNWFWWSSHLVAALTCHPQRALCFKPTATFLTTLERYL